MRILTVCTGNVCRSPFLERALQRGLDQAWGPGRFEVRSAGTGALVGEPMDPRAAAQLGDLGTADGFVARAITPEIVAQSDLVLTATRAHRGRVVTLTTRALRSTFTFLEFADIVSGLQADGPEALTPDADPADRVRAVIAAIPALRAQRHPLTDEEADIVDPFRRDDAVFVRMREQIVSGLPAALRALGAP